MTYSAIPARKYLRKSEPSSIVRSRQPTSRSKHRRRLMMNWLRRLRSRRQLSSTICYLASRRSRSPFYLTRRTCSRSSRTSMRRQRRRKWSDQEKAYLTRPRIALAVWGPSSSKGDRRWSKRLISMLKLSKMTPLKRRLTTRILKLRKWRTKLHTKRLKRISNLRSPFRKLHRLKKQPVNLRMRNKLLNKPHSKPQKKKLKSHQRNPKLP